MTVMNLTKHQKADIVAEVILQSYWHVNEERIAKWIKEKLDFNLPDEPPEFDDFVSEFPYNVGYDDPSVCEMLNEQLDHFRLAGYSVTNKVMSDFKSAFESLLDHIMTAPREEQRLEALEYQREYREVAV